MKLKDVDPAALYRRRHIAALLGVSCEAVRRWEMRGDLQAIVLGSRQSAHRRYTGSAIIAFLLKRNGAAPPPPPADELPIKRAILPPNAFREP